MKLLWLVVIVLFAAGCATIMQGSTQQIMVTSSPVGANLIVDGGMRFKTPAALELSRKDRHTVEIALDGYQTEVVDVRPVTSGAVFGNILAGGLVGIAVDTSTGGAYRLEPEVIKVSLRAIATETQQVQSVSNAEEPEVTQSENQLQTGSQ